MLKPISNFSGVISNRMQRPALTGRTARQSRLVASNMLQGQSMPFAAQSDLMLKIGAFIWVRADHEQTGEPASAIQAAVKKYSISTAAAQAAYENFMRTWDRPQERIQLARIWFFTMAEMCSELGVDLDAELERVATAG